jgi:predicted  nucleic acid-binding Zn-ribbon protein
MDKNLLDDEFMTYKQAQHGFGIVNERINENENEIKHNSKKIKDLEKKVDMNNSRISGLNKTISKVKLFAFENRKQMLEMKENINSQDDDIKQIYDRFTWGFKIIIAAVITGLIGVVINTIFF